MLALEPDAAGVAARGTDSLDPATRRPCAEAGRAQAADVVDPGACAVELTRLGRTGLEVSRICLGCMSFGTPDRGGHPWTLDEEQSRPFIKRALELGITFFDTANVYSDGTSEEILGRALKEYAGSRDEVVHRDQGPRPHAPRAQRRRAVAQGDHDADRRVAAPAQTDHVDLYQVHRWDPHTPVEETVQALHDVVQAGKARYVGASSMWAWQFGKALHVAELRGLTRFVSMQDHYNLLQREEEREMLPLCADEGIGVLPWSPLARGRLTRDWDDIDGALADRRLRRAPLRRGRPDDRRAGWPRSPRERGVRARPGRPGLAARQARRHRADRGGDEARSTSTTPWPRSTSG